MLKRDKDKRGVAMLFMTATIILACFSTPRLLLVEASSAPGKTGGNWFGNLLGVNVPPNPDLDNDNKRQKSLQHGGISSSLPPPPPPQQQDMGNNVMENGMDNENQQEQPPQPPPPPQQQQQQQPFELPPRPWGTGPLSSNNMPLPPPPPPQFESSSQPQLPQQGYPDDWHMQQMLITQQQQQQHYPSDADEEIIQSLQSDIESLLSHQNGLYNTIQNLTSTIQDNDQMLQFQINQIDVLLEQVADAEAYASAESNAALEYKQNATILGETIRTMQSKVDELEQSCQIYEENEKCNLEEIQKLKDRVKKKEKELENLARGVEMARLEQQKEKYKERLEKKKQMKKNRGLVSWLFNYLFSSGGGSSVDDDDTDDELEKLQDLARSTLLHALQSERNNVHELEAALSSTQQNNTAITEMVSSRDSLIYELNDRVAVFEEDKVVLKAALRQLQKEMKDEAPKTQQLVSDLEAAKEEIENLEETIDELKSNHTNEIEVLEELIREKDLMINETDSKMSMISVYVDQLEERLATFAVARRDINVREEACKEIEERNVQASKKYIEIEKQLKEVTISRDEFKGLSDLLTEERTKLLEEKSLLVSERDSLLLKEAALSEELNILQDSFGKLESEVKEATDSLDKAQAEIREKEQILNTLNELNEEAKLKLDEQEESLQKSIAFGDSLKEELTQLEGENERISAQVISFEEKIKQIIAESEEKFVNQLIIEAEKIAAEKIEAERIEIEKRAEEEIAIALARQEEIEAKRVHTEIERRATEELIAASAHEEEIGLAEGYNGVEVEFEVSAQEIMNPTINEADGSFENEYHSEHSVTTPPPPPADINKSAELLESEVVEKDGIEYHTSNGGKEILPPPPPPPLPDSFDSIDDNNDKVLDDEVSESIERESPYELTISENNSEAVKNAEDNFFLTPDEESSRALDDVEVDKEKSDLFPHPPPPPPPIEIEEKKKGVEKIFHFDDSNVGGSNFDVNIQDGNEFLETQYEETFDNVGANEEKESIFSPPPPPIKLEDIPIGENSFDFIQETNIKHSEEETYDYMAENQNFMERNIDHLNVYKDKADAFPQTLDDEAIKDKLIREEENNYPIGGETGYPDSEKSAINKMHSSIHDETVSFEAIYQEEGDDFEIISDDDTLHPAGYFEENVDEEDVFNADFDNNEEYNDSEINEEDESERCTDSQDYSDAYKQEKQISNDDEPSLPSDYFGDDTSIEEIQGDFEVTEVTKQSESDIEIPSLDKKDSDEIQGTFSPPTKRKVPFRKLRKTFASLTGVHGLFTPPSKPPKPVLVVTGKRN